MSEKGVVPAQTSGGADAAGLSGGEACCRVKLQAAPLITLVENAGGIGRLQH